MLEIRTFGGFQIELNGAPLDLMGLRPRARTLLRLLIQAALWPGAPSTTTQSLHVAMSSLRGALEPRLNRAGQPLLVRDGSSYRMAVGPDVRIDIVTFHESIAVGRRARRSGDVALAKASFQSALACHVGDLLPEDGAADWVVECRDRCRLAAAVAAEWLAELRLRDGDAVGAVEAAVSGLGVDRYHDPLWRLLVRAREEAGDRAAATRGRAEYHRVLAELGLERAG